MPDYSVFGGCLRSDLTFPELRPHPGGTPDWTLRKLDVPPPADDGVLLRDAQISDSVGVRLYRRNDGFRVTYDDTGSFDVSEDGARIVWYPAPNAEESVAQLDVIGYVFAVALHAAGILSLHGSAVALQAGGIGFIAPKLHGKSTLARALTSAGARLLTDDAFPVVAGPPARIWPGVHQFRLWSDSASFFADDQSSRSGYGGKHVVTALGADQLMAEPVPLSALYVLAPVKEEPGVAAVQRSPLSPMHATLCLVAHSKAGSLLGKTESAVILDRAADLVRCVPVYRLDVVRNFERLDEVVRTVLGWHGGPVSDPAVAVIA